MLFHCCQIDLEHSVYRSTSPPTHTAYEIVHVTDWVIGKWHVL